MGRWFAANWSLQWLLLYLLHKVSHHCKQERKKWRRLLTNEWQSTQRAEIRTTKVRFFLFFVIHVNSIDSMPRNTVEWFNDLMVKRRQMMCIKEPVSTIFVSDTWNKKGGSEKRYHISFRTCEFFSKWSTWPIILLRMGLPADPIHKCPDNIIAYSTSSVPLCSKRSRMIYCNFVPASLSRNANRCKMSMMEVRCLRQTKDCQINQRNLHHRIFKHAQ